MKCAACGSKMTVDKETRFHYAMSGLSKVYLNGVTISLCSNKDCGEEEIEIPNMEELHNLLAQIIAKQEHKLIPEEIRFLRTHLGFSGIDFARKIGVDAATVSRWENGKIPMGEVPERLLRLMILAKQAPIFDYDLMDKMAKKESSSARRRSLKMDRSHWVEDAA